MKFKECECCGASLDFGERCECEEIKETKLNELLSLFNQDEDGQLILGGQYEHSKNQN